MVTTPFLEYSKKDLKLFEYIITKYSLSLCCPLYCYLNFIDTKKSPIKQRYFLRKTLIQKIKLLYPQKLCIKQENTLLNLNTPPALNGASISITHSQQIEGFILASPFKYSLGFDLEILERAKTKTVLRISNKQELNKAPSNSILWSAKEAAYKSIKLSCIYITQVEIFDWEPITLNNSSDKMLKNTKLKIYHYKFKAKNNTGNGFISVINTLVIGFAKRN